jgi:glyoxylase-like metal-dependent hydrolase (beta-lactamase superfamily II)
MKASIFRISIFAFLVFLPAQQVLSQDFEVLCEITGPIKTNCYLLYDAESKEAALFDVGGSIDSLISVLTEKNLKLKYIFATHCHMDHLEGVPLLKNKFPDALVCYNSDDYSDFLVFREWIKRNTDLKELEEMMQDTAIAKWFSYDFSIFGEPDIYLEDNQIYKLGALEIKTILSPGHSRGSICFYVDNVLFSGDVLFYRTVGRTDLLGGSTEELVKSVRRLYTLLPDETKVYPGHGQSTDIGSEKKENKKITIDNVNMK